MIQYLSLAALCLRSTASRAACSSSPKITYSQCIALHHVMSYLILHCIASCYVISYIVLHCIIYCVIFTNTICYAVLLLYYVLYCNVWYHYCHQYFNDY